MKMKIIKWSLIGVACIVIALLVTHHLYRDAIAIRSINAHLQVEGITLWMDEDRAKKHLGYGKHMPTISFGHIRQYSHLNLQIYYEDGRVASIETQNPHHSIYGVYVGSTVADVKSILEQRSYRLSYTGINHDNGNAFVTYSKANGNIKVSFEIADKHITSIHVQYDNPKNKNRSA